MTHDQQQPSPEVPATESSLSTASSPYSGQRATQEEAHPPDSTLVPVEEIEELWQRIDRLRQEVQKVIRGQEEVIDRLLIALICQGHVLLEGVPGLAKTLMVRTLAQALHLKFSRIQFTPDLLPADITGTLIYNHHTGQFDVRLGPIFANLVLADEINRAPPKVQSALLEAMQERQVTIGERTYHLEEPFMVMATQNPIEQEGTYPLPEAQMDRFLMKILITYPPYEVEREILHLNLQPSFPSVQPIMEVQDVLKMRRAVHQVYMDRKVEDYILQVVRATRVGTRECPARIQRWLMWGASPRGAIALGLCSRAHAFLHRRLFVTPDDVRAIVLDVLRHRIGLSYEAEAEGITPERVLEEILRLVEVP